jgi:hypothetical protein
VSVDLGPEIAYLAIAEGTPVYDRDGRQAGVVEHVLAEDAHDIFEGLLIHTLPLPGRHVYADVDQIAELRERGVLLSVGSDDLHDPDAPAQGPAGEDAELESPVQARLRRAWDWLSGRG